MFAKGDWIVYNSTGVCHVEAVGPLPGNRAADRHKSYYTLTPVRGRETIYIPVDSPVFMRPVMTRREAEELLDRLPQLGAPACVTRDLKLLHAHYRGFLETHSCEDLVRLIRSAHAKSARLEEKGGRPRKIDQDYQRRAEELLYGELSVALGQPYDQVVQTVGQQMCRLA